MTALAVAPACRAPFAADTGTLASIQWLRALAALAVVIYHAVEMFPGHGITAGARLGLPGAAGVDVFFCVSGFIMWMMATRRDVRPLAFLRNRIVRIVPLYWLITTALLVAALVAPRAFARLQLYPDHVLSSYFFIPWRSPIDGTISPLLVQGWTLAYEIFFYLVFAVCLLLGRARALVALAAILIALVVAGCILRPQIPLLDVYTNPLLLEFLAGVLIAEFWRHGRLTLTSTQALRLALAATLALSATAWLGPERVDDLRILVWGVPAAALLIAAITQEPLIARWPQIGINLGDASYSLYLVQGLVIAVLAKLFAPALLSGGLPTHLGFVALALVACAVAGWFCHRLVELPLTRLLRH